ncbi:MAG: MoaD/ThiS family protein [Promethearchaeota archaeon]|jgi:MoaD family protein
MVEIKIRFLSLLTDITETDELILTINENLTIENLLELLRIKFGAKFEELIFKSSQNLSKYVIITINGKDIRLLDGLETQIQNADEINFIPAIAGG